jgi:hypothetical protein
MQTLINLDDVNTKIITIRSQSVILDSDVAQLYGVETRDINKAVKNNPSKFPDGYVFELKVNEFDDLKAISEKAQRVDNQEPVETFHRFLTVSQLEKAKHLQSPPKAFTEKGLYMLATILKSPQAIQATIAIVETFAKLKQLSNNIAYLNSVDPEVIEPEVIESTIEKSSGLLNDLFFLVLPITSAETSVEFNVGFMKGKRTVKSDTNPAVQAQIDELRQMI